MSAKRAEATAPKVVNPDLVAKALAKAVYLGNIVDFRFLFLPFSPAREDSSERFETPKYSYLLPEANLEREPGFQRVLGAVRAEATWRHIQTELGADRPAQLPSDLVLELGDNAVRFGKYTSAAQAYELLRIRQRMQEEFYAAADSALDQGRVPLGVRGYIAATRLAYDYAAFPEPLPEVPDFQTKALLIHGEYPERPEDCVAMQPPDDFVRTALGYLLLSPEAAARLDARPLEARTAFLKELVLQLDSEWPAFAKQYREARNAAGQALARFLGEAPDQPESALARQIEAELAEDPRRAEGILLGREIPDGEWWQYLKELAYQHPAAALFVCRRVVNQVEVLFPLCPADSPVARELGLL